MSHPLPPLSLYVHIPWCVRKCPYCDFNSHVGGGQLPEADYTARLIEDLQRDRELTQGRELVSIFIGGGTPSLFSANSIGRILEAADRLVGFARDIEITLEANPGTAEQQKFSGFRTAGVNRLSIGVQSFQAPQLRRLGRIHSGAEALEAVAMARRAGFDNLNLDLMHGLPAQSCTEAMADLEQALALEPEHLSWYQLTIEPNTVFYHRPPQLPPDDTLADIQERGEALLRTGDFQRYEVSAFARPGRQSLHNRNYWEFGDYLGIGAGAHGKLTGTAGTIERSRKTRQPDHYLDTDKALTAQRRRLTRTELPLEFMMNALRLSEGVPAPLFPRRTGMTAEDIANPLRRLRRDGLLVADNGRLQATATGFRFLNTVLEAFVPAA